MSMTETREQAVLESLLPRYIAEGFTVVIYPSSALLPPFMRNYRPDAIALKSDKKIAIEIKGDNPDAKQSAAEISELFAQHSDWELRVYYAPGYPQERLLEPPTIGAIEKAIREILELRNSGHLIAAIMVAWATLEGIGRALLSDQLARSQPAERLVEVLASEGFLMPSEADTLRRMAELRNAVAHGQLVATVTEKDIDELIAAVRSLADLLPDRPRPEASP
jgi:uncharacterized protein YutE (UPF0331/DUF86 family)